MERTYTIREVSEQTKIPRTTIYDAIARGDITTIVPHGCSRGRRIRESEVERWVASMEVRATD
jgi:excisionase family DNA binding protein